MGAWGYGNFENDNASDWLYELQGVDDLSVVIAALKAVLEEPSGELDSATCCIALAAAEIVAALAGKPLGSLPEIAQFWVCDKSSPTAETVLEAKVVATRVREKSELRELWAETNDFGLWLKAIENLASRL